MEKDKKNRVLKFLAELMSEEEKKVFLLDLEIDQDLNEIYLREKSKFEVVDSKPVVEEQYFVNLLPNVRAKIEKQSKTKWYYAPSAKFALTLIILIALGINFVDFSKNQINTNFTILADSSSFEMFLSSEDDYLSEIINEDYLNDLSSFEVLETTETEVIAYQDISDYSINLSADTYVDDLSDFSVSEEEIKKILENLGSKDAL